KSTAKSEKTIVVSGIPDGIVKDDVMADILMIHFQKPKNRGGDVKDVVYPTTVKGVAYIIFEDQEVTENVLQKDEHRLEDKRLGRYYPLKISLYSDMFSPVSRPVLDLSIFGDKYILDRSGAGASEDYPALSFRPLHPMGKFLFKGSFPAIKSPKDNLLLKQIPFQEGQEGREKKCGLFVEPNNTFVHNVNREEQVVVLDTDIYCYMKRFLYKEITDGEITTIYLENASASSDSRELERAKEEIEICLQNFIADYVKKDSLLMANTRSERLKYKRAFESIKSRFPKVLVIHYDTHIDVIGSSSETYEFTQEVVRTVKSQKGPS
uniref:RNA binding motif protein 43 n=1 Tax=Gopherus evgoodei TaxID=1825980 RepID=A0A8C5F2Y7_9SAUR